MPGSDQTTTMSGGEGEPGEGEGDGEDVSSDSAPDSAPGPAPKRPRGGGAGGSSVGTGGVALVGWVGAPALKTRVTGEEPWEGGPWAPQALPGLPAPQSQAEKSSSCSGRTPCSWRRENTARLGESLVLPRPLRDQGSWSPSRVGLAQTQKESPAQRPCAHLPLCCSI